VPGTDFYVQKANYRFYVFQPNSLFWKTESLQLALTAKASPTSLFVDESLLHRPYQTTTSNMVTCNDTIQGQSPRLDLAPPTMRSVGFSILSFADLVPHAYGTQFATHTLPDWQTRSNPAE